MFRGSLLMVNNRIFYPLLLIFFSLLPLDLASAAVQSTKNPNSAKACAICHFRWIDTFFVEGKGSDLVEYQSEKVVAKPEMCFSCHDGSVKDSRARVYHDSGHKTNKPPPAQMRIPEIFPLDEDGNMQCSTCHTAHGVQGGEGSDDTIFMRTSNRTSEMCRQCHPERDGGMVAGNHPIGATKQDIPARLVALGAAAGGEKNQIVCETCHTAHGSPYESLLIESAENSTLCLDCHRDKNIFEPDGRRKPFHVIDVAPQKATIPKALMEAGAKLGRRGVLTCQTCHKVHTNKIGGTSLLVTTAKKSSLCLTCHVDKKYLVDTKHNLMRSAPGERNLEGETVAQAGVCSACHLPHKAARKVTGKKDLTTELCLSCHGKGNIAEKVNLSGNTHPLNVNPFAKRDKDVLLAATDIEKGKLNLPLFNKYGVQDRDGRVTCSTCHDTHGSRADAIKGSTGNKADHNTLFLRRRSPDICSECHRNKFQIANSKHDLKKVAPTEKNILQQTPAESGLCGSCHLVHGSHKGFLWARSKTTANNGVSENFCISCHNEDGMARNRLVKEHSHPLNVSPSEKGLTSTLPLFDRSGKILEDGVIRCQTCHDPHRWDPVNIHLEDHFDIEGNSQNSFLRIENTPSPTLCANCHADKAYIEETDHDLAVTAPHSKNIIGQSPAASGTCGVCHLVHNGRNETLLWAQEFGSGTNVMERMCNSCHSESGWAKDKVPPIASHPKSNIVNLGKHIKGRGNYFPLFHRTSGEPVTVGDISCPTCHNVHQWNPGEHAKGKGVNLEGNATNSFLRARSSMVMCSDCHGIDALFRFKYYHDPKERKKQISHGSFP
jgi:predicted CXXCH cytochrome family protein